MSTSGQAKASTLQEAGVGSLFLALLAHACWGSYPVVSKRLLAELPPFVLLSTGYLLIAGATAQLLWTSEWRQVVRSPRWWLLMGLVSGRMITNILSINATRATYVQLINLLTPFAVTLLGRALFSERMPRGTIPALVLSTLGSYLVIARGPLPDLASEHWRTTDSYGIAIALVSTLFLALYMLLTRSIQVLGGAGPKGVFVQQSLVLTVVSLVTAGVRQESWEPLLQLTPFLWLLLVGFAGLNLAGGNLLQIMSLGRLSTTLFTGLLGTRLVVALLLANLLLNEQLSSIWQLVGAVIVIATVTWYVLKQA